MGSARHVPCHQDTARDVSIQHAWGGGLRDVGGSKVCGRMFLSGGGVGVGPRCVRTKAIEVQRVLCISPHLTAHNILQRKGVQKVCWPAGGRGQHCWGATGDRSRCP